jgi:hypothetical protein
VSDGEALVRFRRPLPSTARGNTPAGGWLSEAHRGERPVRGERDAIDELERLERTERENISGL